jgi:hypothetical protein
MTFGLLNENLGTRRRLSKKNRVGPEEKRGRGEEKGVERKGNG